MNKSFDIQKTVNNFAVRVIRTAGQTGKTGQGRDYIRVWPENAKEFISSRELRLIGAIEQVAAGVWDCQPDLAAKKAAERYIRSLADFREAGYLKRDGKLFRLDVEGGKIIETEITKQENPGDFTRGAFLVSIAAIGWSIDAPAGAADSLLKILQAEDVQAAYRETRTEKREARVVQKIAARAESSTASNVEVKIIPRYRLVKGGIVLPGVYTMTAENAAGVYEAAKMRGLEVVPA